MKGSRSPAVALLGVGLILFSIRDTGAPAAAAAPAVTHPVLVAARAIPAGSAVAAADVRVVDIAAVLPGTKTAPSQVAGRFVKVNVAAGRMIDDSIVTASPIAEKQQQVTVNIDPRYAPRGLSVDDVVTVVAADTSGLHATALSGGATVASVATGSPAGELDVTVDCSADDALAIAGQELAGKAMTVIRTQAND